MSYILQLDGQDNVECNHMLNSIQIIRSEHVTHTAIVKNNQSLCIHTVILIIQKVKAYNIF